MSIAVSAVVRPSRLLLAAIGAMCLCILSVAVTVGFGAVGELPFGSRVAIAVICAGTAFSCFFAAIQSRKTFHIDISGVGQIRLSQDNDAAGISGSRERPDQRGSGEVVQLLADSTIWPGMLLLRLAGQNRRVTNLLILPDSLAAQDFRALSVACRWIAAHNNRAEGGLAG
jgi:toxin CptA